MQIITPDALELLKKTPPFCLLGEDALRGIVAGISLEFYPRDHTILRQDGPSADSLAVIKSGAVKVFFRTNEGEDVLLDRRGPGGSFGLLSLLWGERAVATVVATEDTTCYLIGQETALRLLSEHAAFSEFFLRFYLKRLTDMMGREIQDRSLLYGGGDKLLFTNTLGDLATKETVRAPAGITIREAAAVMSRHKVSSLVLMDDAGFPAGIVTDRDLRDKVVAKGRDPGDRVSGIMSVTLIKSESKDYCYEALLKMIRYNIHHLLVVNRGDLAGIITNHDLMMLQGTSPLSIARELELQESIDGLSLAQHKIDRLIAVLVREGARASTITRIITEVNDRLVKRMVEIVEAKLGPPPVPYCWIAFGSEGRKEQTFRTDQDNAIIYADPQPGDEERASAYFAGFAAAMKDALLRCGFPACPADFMASNPRWRQPLAVWKEYFRSWISRPTPEAVLHSLIFFDFRPLHGDILLAEHLRASLRPLVKNQRLFLMHMAAAILNNRPPLGRFGRLKFERQGPRKDTINIKINGLTPIVDAARLCALDASVYTTSTLDRLRELGGKHGVIAEFSGELEQAFEFIMGLRLRHQFRRREAGEEPDNFIGPAELSALEQQTLKESFRMINTVQAAIEEHYQVASVM